MVWKVGIISTDGSGNCVKVMIQFVALMILLLSGMLFFYNRKVQPNALYLALSLTVMGIMFVSQSILIFGGSAFLLAVLFNHFVPFYFLLGPLLFFYVRSTLTDRNTIVWRDSLHFLPFLLSLIGVLPYLFMPWEFKLSVAGELLYDLHNLTLIRGLTLYPIEVNRVLRPLSWVGYTTYCLVWVVVFYRRYPGWNRIPRLDAMPVIRFMFLFLIVSLLTAVVYTALSFLLVSDAPISRIRYISNPLMYLLLSGLAGLSILLLINPAILYGIPRIPGATASPGLQPVMDGRGYDSWDMKEAGNEVMTASGQDAAVRFRELAASIPKVIEERQLYLDPDFSLEDLARALAVPKHHIYYCFNSILKTRFTRLRSEYRVKHVQRLIREGATKEKTLDAIGLESGFSSSTTFRAVFREVTGMSPSEHMASLLQD